MARQIIVLDMQQSGTTVRAFGVYWLTAPTNRVRPLPTFVSSVPTLAEVAVWGATTNEVNALRAGTIVECTADSGWRANVNAAAVALQNGFAAAQASLEATTPAAKYVGANWDGTTWTVIP